MTFDELLTALNAIDAEWQQSVHAHFVAQGDPRLLAEIEDAPKLACIRYGGVFNDKPDVEALNQQRERLLDAFVNEHKANPCGAQDCPVCLNLPDYSGLDWDKDHPEWEFDKAVPIAGWRTALSDTRFPERDDVSLPLRANFNPHQVAETADDELRAEHERELAAERQRKHRRKGAKRTRIPEWRLFATAERGPEFRWSGKKHPGEWELVVRAHTRAEAIKLARAGTPARRTMKDTERGWSSTTSVGITAILDPNGDALPADLWKWSREHGA